MLILVLALLACTRDPSDVPKDTGDTEPTVSDVDRDGYTTAEGDCDDGDDGRHPGALEACDSVDQDCDGEVDEGVGNVYYADSDEDGYGDPGAPIAACELPQDAVATATDCDDADPGAFPGAPEVCDGDDDDCDGTVDDGVSVAWWADLDGDGFGDDGGAAVGCEVPADAALEGGDCDDGDDDVNPLAVETCDERDEDCDGEVDEGVTLTWWADVDADGFGDADLATEACTAPTGYAERDDDCDDGAPAVNPAAVEVCDGVDNDCDGAVDPSDASGVTTWFADTDADGYGGATATAACVAPTGYVASTGDCDDGAAATYPGAPERCDDADNDCDGAVDESAVDATTWYIDYDSDGFGGTRFTTVACDAPSGYVADGSDCDDASGSRYPGATEVCNDADDDCDGAVDDDASGADIWFADVDGDGWGDVTDGVASCDEIAGRSVIGDDCEPYDATAYPGAPEVCDGVDDNCDGTVDEASAEDAGSWYLDDDGDGWGDADVSVTQCEAPADYVASSTDCDDAAATRYPGAPETCNDADDDCDGVVDDSAVDATTWYVDYDADGFGGTRLTAVACDAPSGYVADATDCDDAAASRYPGAEERCNDADDDCDGRVDEADALDAAVWYADVDADGWGDTSDTSIACDAPAGSVSLPGDCATSDATAYPGAPEYCDGVDDDCDGTVDEADALDARSWYLDDDGDGFGGASTSVSACDAPTDYVASSSDCADAYASRYPGAPEVCNGADDDCDGAADDGLTYAAYYTDGDSDGYGAPSSVTVACEAPSGAVTVAGDCDDASADVSPADAEVCNDVDDDCDGTPDDGLSLSVWYVDGDGDGYGSAAVTDCARPSGAVATGGDCDDGDATVSPGAAEVCDGEDDDCDGTVDDGVLGTGAACPAEDCAEIYDTSPTAGSGSYVLDAGTYYCDMSSYGGGWTRVADNLPVWGTGYDTTYRNSEGFRWNEVLFRYDSGSVTAHCTYPGSMTGCNNLGFQFDSEAWGVPLNWGSSICGMSTTDYTSATTYVGGYDFTVTRALSTSTIRLGALEGISYCTPSDNPGTAYVDVFVRR
jgi:hypothetical protein